MSSTYGGINATPLSRASFPYWVIRKIGEPLLLETDWNYSSFPNTKYGALLAGTSTISRETSVFYWGGLGSIKMLTDAVTNDYAEVKTAIKAICQKGDLLAFEQKWAQNYALAASSMDTGIESRIVPNILQARFRYILSAGEWTYESATDTYSSFPASTGGPLITKKPVLSASVGTFPGWTRVVIDPNALTYYGFEADGDSGHIETRDMHSLNIPLTANGAATTSLYLFFMYAITGGNTAEPAYSTDWCISRIPLGVNPFS
jgi:hypothetical protein